VEGEEKNQYRDFFVTFTVILKHAETDSNRQVESLSKLSKVDSNTANKSIPAEIVN